MKEPTFDKNGYPTEETLNVIEKWNFSDGIEEWFEYIQEAWAYEEYFKINKPFYNISTAGWSGNEDIIRAMRPTILWAMTWVQSRKGGHYIFELPGKEIEE